MGNEDKHIEAAIQTAEDYLLAGEALENAFSEAAREHGLLPKRLANRFALKHGDPTEWVVKRKAAAAALAAAAAVNDAEDAHRFFHLLENGQVSKGDLTAVLKALDLMAEANDATVRMKLQKVLFQQIKSVAQKHGPPES